MNDPVIAEKAAPDIPLALSAKLATPSPTLPSIPSTPAVIEVNLPVTFVAKLVARFPPAIALDTAFPTVDVSLVTSPSELVALLAAFLTKSAVGPTPTVDAADTIPAIVPADSPPVIAPALVNAVCACCMLVTLALTCAARLLENAFKFSAPGAPVNKLLVIAADTLEPFCTNPVTNAAAPGFNTAASICCGVIASDPTAALSLPVASVITPDPVATTEAAVPAAELAAAPTNPAVTPAVNALLAAPAPGTVDNVDALAGLAGAVDADAVFAAAAAGVGGAGNPALALVVTLTSTPWPALAHGACAGARLTIDNKYPGAAAYPLLLSPSVSVCAT